jgi:hypothetical protein
MALWITCCSGTDVRALAPATSHDEVHQALDRVLDDHSRHGHRIRNVLRDNSPAWDVMDAAGAVLATYWISRGSLISNESSQAS